MNLGTRIFESESEYSNKFFESEIIGFEFWSWILWILEEFCRLKIQISEYLNSGNKDEKSEKKENLWNLEMNFISMLEYNIANESKRLILTT